MHVVRDFCVHITCTVESVFLDGARTTEITIKMKLPTATTTIRLVLSMGAIKHLLEVKR